MTRRAPSNSVALMVDAAQAVAAGDIEPPDHLDLPDEARPFWVDIVRTRARKEWSPADMSVAANLARCMCDIERLSAELRKEDDVLTNSLGTKLINPKHALLETMSRRQVALFRLLQLHPIVSGEPHQKVGARRAEKQARETANEVQSEADLLA